MSGLTFFGMDPATEAEKESGLCDVVLSKIFPYASPLRLMVFRCGVKIAVRWVFCKCRDFHPFDFRFFTSGIISDHTQMCMWLTSGGCGRIDRDDAVKAICFIMPIVNLYEDTASTAGEFYSRLGQVDLDYGTSF
ncbi:hypothetical protein NE237_004038 [Protea cynaroides]|uniref:Uncharacterized protein n=1 Tax=Protea cynaroides TaxID=273540 RepID=A0A9Q0KI60_9MAGN|nr:hypothetical protein NE237_004038 [Protea cynaroides]